MTKRQHARISGPSVRELAGGGGGAPSQSEKMKFAVIVFPGSNCDHDAYHAAKHVLGQEAEFVWHKETSLQGRRRGRSCRAASRTATTCGPARSRASRRSWTPSRAFARRRRAGARHLQRLSDPARSRPAARRDAAQPRSQVPLRARRRPRRADRHAVHARAATGQVLRMPIAHGEGNYFADPAVHRRARGVAAGRSSATAMPTAQLTDEANPNGS